MEIPAFYYYDAKYVPHVKDFVVTMSFHIIPQRQMYQDNVQTTYMDGRVEQNSFDEIYEQTGQNIILNLFCIKERKGFEMQRQFILKDVNSAIMEFSKSGKFFALFYKDQNILNVYNSQDIFQCFDQIKLQKPLCRMKIDHPQFQHAHQVKFDFNDKFVLVCSMTHIMIYSLWDEAMGLLHQSCTIDQTKYSGILDIVIDSDHANKNSIDGITHDAGDGDDSTYVCQVACKANGITLIQIYDINEQTDTRNIIYTRNTPNIIVKISEDFQMVIFSNGVENYLLKGRSQEYFQAIKDKFLRHVIDNGKSFYLVTSKDYDRDIDILSSNEREFNASIIRSIEPGILQVYDSMIEPNENSKLGHLKTMIKLGESIFCDTINLDKCYNEEPTEAVIKSVEEKQYHAYGFNWPYFSYATKNNQVIILNAFNPSTIQRYELPENISIITHTFLTDTSDFYVHVETIDDHFETYHIDLDSVDPRIVGPLARYAFDKVEGKRTVHFHSRASSVKEKINLNKVLQHYMIHGTDLWGWTANRGLMLISKDAYNIQYLSDDVMFYMHTLPDKIKVQDRMVEHSTVHQIECLFGSFRLSQVYEDLDMRAEILNYGVDNTRKRLLILTGIKNNHDKRDKFITIFDIESEKVLHRIMIDCREIIGRLKSNLYNFTNGHIYYNNKVIKIRYDIIQSSKGAQISQTQLFDHYGDIIHLEDPHDTIQSGTPLKTCLYNRLAYVIKNHKRLRTIKVLILPYLHERRIYLNRRHEANQFYSITEHDGLKFILCLCVNDNKIYVYTETGILCERIVYDEIAEKCGKPESCSENGENFLFKKSHQSYDFHILNISVKGMEIINSFNIKQKISEYLSNQQIRIKQRRLSATERLKTQTHINNEQESSKEQKNYDEMMFFWTNYLNMLNNLKDIMFQYNINDNGDVMVRVRPTQEYIKFKSLELFNNDEFMDEKESEKKMKEEIMFCSFFFFLPSQNSSTKEFLYFDSTTDDTYDLKGCSMNENFIFFWNVGVVWSLDLRTQELMRLPIYISEQETSTCIKIVRCGSNENLILIRVTQSPLNDCIIYWDLEHQREVDYFDVDSSALTFQDARGTQYIIERDNVYSIESSCKMKCYRAKVSDFDISSCKFGFQYGYRVECDTHNWMIFRNYINLSFSYMTFVIKENFDKNMQAMNTYSFDIEGYDFVLDRSTIFTENNGALLQQDFQKITFILKNYMKHNPIYIESIQYMNKHGKLPIHFALQSNNNRVVNLLLGYMAKIDHAAVHTIKNIFKDLINFQKFEFYLQECPFRTKQMRNKQTLKLVRTRRQMESSDILVCTPSQCSYVDDVYFQEKMGEAPTHPQSLTFAVNIQSVRADWIINDEEGLLFLKELLRQQNKDVFMTPYIQIVIEFLYQKYSANIMTRLMPPFLMHLISVFVLIFLSEKERDHLVEGIDQQEDDKKANHITFWKNVVQIIAFVLNVVNLLIFGMQTYHLKWMQLKRFWAYLDFFQLSANLVVSSSLIITFNVIHLRIYEAVLSVIMMLKILYFLRLIGEIAPLIDIIFTIINQIRFFMAIYLIALTAFICAFYSIGRNQAQLQGEFPSYSTYLGSFNHVYLSSLGEFNTDEYFDNSMTPVLVFLFLMMSFFMCIHLLNMLIAIMGDIFQNDQKNKEAKKKMSQLAFVVENWWIDPIVNKDQIMYLIAAFKIEEDDDSDEQRYKNINDKMLILFTMQTNLMLEMKLLEQQIKSQKT